MKKIFLSFLRALRVLRVKMRSVEKGRRIKEDVSRETLVFCSKGLI